MELGEASFRKKMHINRFIWPVLDLKIQNPRRALATAALLARYTEGERRALHVLCWSRWAFAPPAPSINLPGKRWWACSTICSAPTLPIGLRPESSVLLGLGWAGMHVHRGGVRWGSSSIFRYLGLSRTNQPT